MCGQFDPDLFGLWIEICMSCVLHGQACVAWSAGGCSSHMLMRNPGTERTLFPKMCLQSLTVTKKKRVFGGELPLIHRHMEVNLDAKLI